MRRKGVLAALLASAALGTTPIQAQDIVRPAPESFAEALMSGPILLSRTIQHYMPDGAVIAVTRTYRITVYAMVEGWLLEGESIAVDIDAPSNVADIAALERKRKDDVFPLRLSRAGGLLPYDEPRPNDRGGLLAARHLIAQRIATAPVGSVDADSATAMLRTLSEQFGSSRTSWPIDLFRPTAATRMETREVPGGNVTVALIADTHTATGLLSRYERVVTTRIGASERVVRETWKLQPDQTAE